MDHYEPADDDKYTVGIAAALCLAALAVIFLGTQPLVSTLRATWIPWLVGSLFTLVPIVMAFIVLYTHAWRHKWPRPTRVLISLLLSCIIFCADLLFIGYFTLLLSLYSNGIFRGG